MRHPERRRGRVHGRVHRQWASLFLSTVTQQPVVIAIEAPQPSFQVYSSGMGLTVLVPFGAVRGTGDLRTPMTVTGVDKHPRCLATASVWGSRAAMFSRGVWSTSKLRCKSAHNDYDWCWQQLRRYPRRLAASMLAPTTGRYRVRGEPCTSTLSALLLSCAVTCTSELLSREDTQALGVASAMQLRSCLMNLCPLPAVISHLLEWGHQRGHDVC